jgi:hypothetical protein
MNKLLFINGLGSNYKGDNLYEFIFGDTNDVWGEEWDTTPAASKPLPPQLDNVEKVGILKTSNVELELVQNSDYFSMEDAIDGVICLGWENNNFELVPNHKPRLVFHFGEPEEDVKGKLYERDIILEFDKKVKYEHN